jgi:hypothetical protein
MNVPRRRIVRGVSLLLVAGLVSGLAATSSAQRFFREGRMPPRYPPHTMPDRDFAFCKLMYNSVRYEALGMGWATDYPYAGINLMTRFSELTTAQVSTDTRGEPNHWVVQLTDQELFNCPFIMAADVGTIGLSGDEASQLREYLLKGGFLWVDDFWGSRAWEHWSTEIGRVLPPGQYPIHDLPLDHPVFRTLSYVEAVPQITAIQFWWGSGGTTSERGADSAVAHLRAITDEHDRVLVLMSHNTDVADSWEREGEDPRYFEQFSPNGYGLGINVLLYAMSH